MLAFNHWQTSPQQRTRNLRDANDQSHKSEHRASAAAATPAHQHRYHTTRNHAAIDTHSGHDGHAGHGHSHMVADLRKRFWISLLLTLPVLALS
jgi:Cu2+-exporting ATPase